MYEVFRPPLNSCYPFRIQIILFMNKSGFPHTALTNLNRRTNLLGLDDYPGNKREPNALPEPRKQSWQYFALSEPKPYTVLLARYGKENVSQVLCSLLELHTVSLSSFHQKLAPFLFWWLQIFAVLYAHFFPFPTRQIL